MADVLVFVTEQWMLVAALLVLIFLFIQHETRRGGATVSSHQLTAMINRENAVVLDVREAAQFKEGHIVDAVHIPFTKVKDRLSELDKYKQQPIIIVDKMGQHTGAVGKQLSEAGFTISRLQGGMTDWKASNLPLIKE